MPKRSRSLIDVAVVPSVSKADLVLAEEFMQFDPVTGSMSFRESPDAVDRYISFVASLAVVVPFVDFVRSLGEGTGRLPAFVCDRLCTQARIRIRFIWDERNDGQLRHALSKVQPYLWPGRIGYGGILFGCHLWTLSAAEGFYPEDELRLAFLDAVDQERRKFERLKARYDRLGGAPVKHRREAIPEEVRMYVWRRDGGRCVQCESNEKLEYDHIIPVSKGGSSTERNIQLLCELCNRRKSDSV